MLKESEFIRELHKIRKEHYEKTKHRDREEVMKEIETRTEKTIKKLGLKRYKSVKSSKEKA